jgi:hypothetical protein
MPARMSAANSSPSGRRATPTMANCLGSRQQIGLAQVKQRGQQLALGQIARGAKDHQDSQARESAPTPWDLGKIFGAHFHLDGGHVLS